MWTPRRQHSRAGWVNLTHERKRYKKGGGSAPPAVDPNALGNAQLQANIGTAQKQSELGNFRVNTPFGSSAPEQDASGRWNLTNTLSPGVQGVFNNQVNLARNLAGLGNDIANLSAAPAQSGTNLIGTAFQNLGGQIPTGPVSLDGLPSLASDINPGQIYSGFAQTIPTGNFTSNVPTGAFTGNVQSGPIQNSLDFGGLVGLPTSSTDFSNEVKQAQNAAYNSQAQYLDPQFGEKRSDLTQQLADQGISPGTAAYDRAVGDLGRQENLAYSGARDAAVQAGNQEQAQLFGENLSSRQQGVGERQAQGNFANQAEQLGFGQGLQNAGLTNAAEQARFGEGLQNAGLANTAEQGRFGESQAAQDFYNQALLAQNQAENQDFQQRLGSAQFNNQVRDQGINERSLLAGQPLNFLGNAVNIGEGVLSGAAGSIPTLGSLADFSGTGTVPSITTQPPVSPANIVGAGQVGASSAFNRFLAGNTLNNQLFNGLGSLGGALGLNNGGLGNLLGIGGSGGGGLFGGLFGGGGGAGVASGDLGAGALPGIGDIAAGATDFGGGGDFAAAALPDILSSLALF